MITYTNVCVFSYLFLIYAKKWFTKYSPKLTVLTKHAKAFKKPKKRRKIKKIPPEINVFS